jgi:hypothetical protein
MPSTWRLREELGFQTLREAIETLRVDELKYRAGLFDEPSETRKPELVDHLIRQLEGDGLQRLWKQLDDRSQKAVAEAMYDGSEPLNAALFRAKYGSDPPNWHSPSDSRYHRSKEPPRPISMFLFGNGWIPDDLRHRLKTVVPQPTESSLSTVAKLPERVPQPKGRRGLPGMDDNASGKLIREDTALAALHDVRALLALVDDGKVAVGEKTGQVSLAGAKAILPILRNRDFLVKNADDLRDAKQTMRAFAWPLLLQAGKLAEISGSRLRLTKAGKKALTEPPHEVIRDLWSRWLKGTLFDEFRRVSEVKGQTKPRALTAAAERREAIALGLQEARPGEWVAVDEFMRYLVASGLSFAVARDSWSLYIGDLQYGSLGYEDYSNWLPKWYAMVFLWEYAGTLGLVDVSFTEPEEGHRDYGGNWGTDDVACLSPHDGLYYFRVNSLGAWALGLASEYLPPKEEVRPVLRVLPNLDVASVDETLDPADALFLGRFARHNGDRVWSLGLADFLRAVEQGVPLPQMRAFLEARCAEPGIPETVAALFADVESRTGRISDQGSARIYACSDAELARLVVSDTRLRRLCRLADERLLVVPAGLDKAFRDALRQIGYVAPPTPAD